MKEICVFLLLVGMKYFADGQMNQVECETSSENQRECNIIASIDSPNFTISAASDEVKILRFRVSRKIRYLPVNIYLSFSNLNELSARNCHVEAVAKDNFRNLTKLETLNLRANLIEMIPDDAFEDLESVRYINLRENNIKFMNGQLFFGLMELEVVDLRINKCINQMFNGFIEADSISDALSLSCGYNETEMVWSDVNFLNGNVSCEEIVRDVHLNINSDNLQCFMNDTTSIDTLGYRISTENGHVTSLTFTNNENVNFLPSKVFKSFPNLRSIHAERCSIKSITKSNLVNLNRLEELWLDDNLIESIPSNAFTGLESLYWIDLSNNKIKFMNIELFHGLIALKAVYLKGNECIDSIFLYEKQLSSMLDTVSSNCAFNETIDDFDTSDVLEEIVLLETTDAPSPTDGEPDPCMKRWLIYPFVILAVILLFFWCLRCLIRS